MENFEKQVPLEAADIKLLNQNVGGSFGCAVLMAAAFLLPVLWMLTWGFSWFQVVLILVALALGSLLVYLLVDHALATKKKVARDISGGVKKVIISPMESQEMKSREKRHRGGPAAGSGTGELVMTYLVRVKGKDYEVPIETYMAIKPGELVEVHLGIHSDITLRVVKAEQSLPARSIQPPDAS